MASKSWIEVPIEQEIESVPDEGYAPFNFPDEGGKLVFEFTQESFTQVLSALINGAALTYPDRWLQVVWYFLQNVEYPVSLCDEIAAAILTCEDVQLAIASLISIPGPVQDAINDLVTTSTEINEYITNIVGRLTEGQIGGKLIADNCDNGVVAGNVIQLIERFDQNNIDFLEILEVGTNDEERVGDLLEAIPIFGELPFGDMIQIAQDFLEDFGENYAGVSTFERKDALAEDLYCLAKQQVDCSLTYQQIFDYLQQEALSGLNIAATLFDIIRYIKDGDFGDDDLLFRGMFAIQTAVILAGNSFNGMNIGKIGSLMRDAAPSTRWEEWDECGSPETCDDLTASENGWTPLITDYATYHSGEGFGPGPIGGGYRAGIQKNVNWNGITVYFNMPLVDAGIGFFAGYNNFSGEGITGLDGGITEIFIDREFTAGIAFEFLYDNNSPLPEGLRITQVCEGDTTGG